MPEDPLLVITGPTASGKTAVSIRVALELGGEIISADSVQVYRHLNIGSAKPTREEMMGVPHHLIDIIDPDEKFSVADYRTVAEKAINEVRRRGRVPIVCGGTIFYIRALVGGYAFPEHGFDPGVRERLRQKYSLLGVERLRQDLQAVDPEAARRIHPNDIRRAIRALEVYEITGRRISDSWGKADVLRVPAVMVAMDVEREELYSRIEERVERMLSAGLVEETRRILEMGYPANSGALHSVGYAEVIAYLKGECTLEEARRLIVRNTKHLAKRQLTWLRNDDRIVWVYAGKHSQLEAVVREISSIYRRHAELGGRR
ncbi:MAG TPA: tRNA (adenosine(37)-N6)-dimethylallyltransferase MiaA [Firmicutes bacterium]|nr:tRNA (adenosine(37)-N6)-dimethylallyltransferase MiaA [Bacillota bacterium]